MIQFGALIAAGFLLWGCERNKENPTQSKSQEKSRGPKGGGGESGSEVLQTSPSKIHALPNEIPPDSKKCPKGFADYPIQLSAGVYRICLEEKGKPDGVFQEDTESLSVMLGDQFVSRKDSKFEVLSRQLRLPPLAGLNVKFWGSSHQLIFPRGADWKDEGLFRELMQWIHENGLNFQTIRNHAEKIRPNPHQNSGKDWKNLSPREKLYALCIATLVEGFSKDENPFHFREPQFIESVRDFIDRGKLSLEDLAQNSPPNDWGGVTMTYEKRWNGIQVRQNIGFGSPSDQSVWLHELFHFYQDGGEQLLKHQDTETQAYFHQAEFLLAHFSQNGKLGPNDSYKAFLSAHFHSSKLIDLALKIVRDQQLGRKEEVEKTTKVFHQELNKVYFLNYLLSSAAFRAQTRYSQMLGNRLEVDSPKQRVLSVLKEEGDRNQRELKKDLKFTEERLPILGASLIPIQGNREIESLFLELMVKWLYQITLEAHLELLKNNSTTFRGPIDLWVKNPKVGEMLQRLSAMEPMKYYTWYADGVEAQDLTPEVSKVPSQP